MTRTPILLAVALGASLTASMPAQAHRPTYWVTTNQGWREDVYAPSYAAPLPRDTNNFCGPGYRYTANGCVAQGASPEVDRLI